MQLVKDANRLGSVFDRKIVTIDSHTAGEPTRLIVGGVGTVEGGTMTEKLEFFKRNFDDVRLLLTREPRGHRGVLAAMVTENVTETSEFGLIYMDAKRYPYLCGHATIGAVVTLVRTGMLSLPNGENRVDIDTPSGVMSAEAFVENGTVRSVAIKMVPSFVLDTNVEIDVTGYGKVHADMVCTGGFFAMISAKEIGRELIPENAPFMADLGMQIIDEANRQVTVYHPERPEVKTVDVVQFYDPDRDARKEGRSLVVYGESNVDRSPCGTGTAAKMTLLHHKGLVAPGEDFVNTSPLGTRFGARITEKVGIGGFEGIVVRIEGMAHVTGVNTLVFEADDPFPQGFLI